MRKTVISKAYMGALILTISICTVNAQKKIGFTLEEVYVLAQQNYPLIKDATLIDKIEKVNLSAIERGALPKLSLNGTAQIQTENVEFPSSNELLSAPLETWNAYLSLDYNLFDGGLKKAKKKIEEAAATTNHGSLKVKLRSIKDRVNTLLFAISLSRKQKEILETSKDDLEVNITSLTSGFEYGTVLESDLSKLKVRQLELTSDIISVNSDIKTYFSLLEQLTGTIFSSETVFVMPSDKLPTNNYQIDRPEQQLYENQKNLFKAQEASISANLMPRLSLFAQGGIGNPNPLNFADFTTSTYALGGLRLQWHFLDFGKGKKEKQALRLQQQQVELDKELFLFDVDSNVREYQEKFEALKAQIKNDEAIVGLQNEILNQSKVQLDNGVISSGDYVTQLNAAISSRKQLEFNKIKLQQTTINYLTLIGQL